MPSTLITHTGLALTAGGVVLGDGCGAGSDEGDGLGAGGGDDDEPGRPEPLPVLRPGWGCGGDGDCSATRCAPPPGWGLMLAATRGRGLRGLWDDWLVLALTVGVPAAPGGSPGADPGADPGPLSTSPSTIMAPAMTAASAPDIEALCSQGLMPSRFHVARW